MICTHFQELRLEVSSEQCDADAAFRSLSVRPHKYVVIKLKQQFSSQIIFPISLIFIAFNFSGRKSKCSLLELTKLNKVNCLRNTNDFIVPFICFSLPLIYLVIFWCVFLLILNKQWILNAWTSLPPNEILFSVIHLRISLAASSNCTGFS